MTGTQLRHGARAGLERVAVDGLRALGLPVSRELPGRVLEDAFEPAFRKDHPVLEELLDGLFHIARADGQIHDAELNYLAEVARLFGFSETDFARIREANLGPDKADPYTVLGVRREMSNEEIRAAWRKLVRDNHPDRLMAHGLPEEFVMLANEKLATINAAYDRISKERGIN